MACEARSGLKLIPYDGYVYQRNEVGMAWEARSGLKPNDVIKEPSLAIMQCWDGLGSPFGIETI